MSEERRTEYIKCFEGCDTHYVPRTTTYVGENDDGKELVIHELQILECPRCGDTIIGTKGADQLAQALIKP